MNNNDFVRFDIPDFGAATRAKGPGLGDAIFGAVQARRNRMREDETDEIARSKHALDNDNTRQKMRIDGETHEQGKKNDTAKRRAAGMAAHLAAIEGGEDEGASFSRNLAHLGYTRQQAKEEARAATAPPVLGAQAPGSEPRGPRDDTTSRRLEELGYGRDQSTSPGTVPSVLGPPMDDPDAEASGRPEAYARPRSAPMGITPPRVGGPDDMPAPQAAPKPTPGPAVPPEAAGVLARAVGPRAAPQLLRYKDPDGGEVSFDPGRVQRERDREARGLEEFAKVDPDFDKPGRGVAELARAGINGTNVLPALLGQGGRADLAAKAQAAREAEAEKKRAFDAEQLGKRLAVSRMKANRTSAPKAPGVQDYRKAESDVNNALSETKDSVHAYADISSTIKQLETGDSTQALQTIAHTLVSDTGALRDSDLTTFIYGNSSKPEQILQDIQRNIFGAGKIPEETVKKFLAGLKKKQAVLRGKYEREADAVYDRAVNSPDPRQNGDAPRIYNQIRQKAGDEPFTPLEMQDYANRRAAQARARDEALKAKQTATVAPAAPSKALDAARAAIAARKAAR